MKKKKIKRIIILVVLAIIVAKVITGISESNKTISYDAFIQKLDAGEIETVHYAQENNEISGQTKGGKEFIVTSPQSTDFKKYLLERNVEVKDANALAKFVSPFINFFVTLLTFYIVFSLFAKSQGKIMKMEIEPAESINLTFDDVAGNKEAKKDMEELIDFMLNPKTYDAYGAKAPKGTILYGPPGTGKTLMAKALAGTAKVSFIAVSGSDFIEKFVGVGASRMRQLFEEARAMSPCIVFIDEIDAVGKKRTGSNQGGHDEGGQTLNQLLVEIDGFKGNEGVIVIAATNRLDVLDPALLRAGRFDRHIEVGLPDLEAREQILKLHSRNKPISDEVDFSEIAKLTIAMSGADLENVMNEASIYAARNKHDGILMKDVDKAINKIIAGEEKNTKTISEEEKKITAYHEAGHALVAKLLEHNNVSKVTIVPTTKGAGGYTLISPKEKMYRTKKDMLNELSTLLGGRAAEELIYGKNGITTGASSDLKSVTAIASSMVKEYGMNETIGLINISELSTNQISIEDKEVNKEIRTLINQVYEKTKSLLVSNKDLLEKIANLLLEKETIYESDLERIFNIHINRTA